MDQSALDFHPRLPGEYTGSRVRTQVVNVPQCMSHQYPPGERYLVDSVPMTTLYLCTPGWIT